MAKKVTNTRTEYDVTLQRREGKNVAIIEVVTSDVYGDRRGYAGQTVADRQVLIVPLSSLAAFTDQIVRTLAYNTTAEPEERYDLDNDAEKRIGLYSPEGALDRKPSNSFYTLAEARQVFKQCGPGWVLAHIPKEGEEWYANIIERMP